MLNRKGEISVLEMLTSNFSWLKAIKAMQAGEDVKVRRYNTTMYVIDKDDFEYLQKCKEEDRAFAQREERLKKELYDETMSAVEKIYSEKN